MTLQMTAALRRSVLMVAALAAAAMLVVGFASLASATPRSGTLKVNKECSHYDGLPGSYCTFYSSNVPWAPVGTNIFYLQPESNSSDAILDPPGPGNNKAFGHCNLPDGLNGTCEFTGGTGKFTHFHVTITVSYLGGLNFHWEGPYSFSPHQ
jgi:hypothetical protein